MTRVIKISGHEMNTPGFLDELGRQVVRLSSEPTVIVHGGGREIAMMQARLGLKAVMVDGLRVTDAESLAVAQMVLSGHTNKSVVVALLAAGLDAVGISGVDGSLLRCRRKHHPTTDLGLVGEVVTVRAALLRSFLEQGIIPVVSPISLGEDDRTYNVNADDAAGAIAGALGAESLDFVSNVPGVLNGNSLLTHLTPALAEALIESGVISGGMIPKVRTALHAMTRGVPAVRIVDLAGLSAGGGTVCLADEQSQVAPTAFRSANGYGARVAADAF